MESKAIKLAKKIATILNGEEYDDAVSALKIAKIMLPSPSAQRKSQKKKDNADATVEEQEANAGSLVPADEQLMRFSKAMGRIPSAAVESVLQQAETDEPEME